jgi:hypothetical protein
MGHNVAPVAGGITDAEKDRAVFPLGSVQGLGSPGIPIYGVIGVLLKIGAFFVKKPIGLATGIHDDPFFGKNKGSETGVREHLPRLWLFSA